MARREDSYRSPGAGAPEKRRARLDADGLDGRAFSAEVKRRKEAREQIERERAERERAAASGEHPPAPPIELFGIAVLTLTMIYPLLLRIFYQGGVVELGPCLGITFVLVVLLLASGYLNGFRGLADLTASDRKKLLAAGALGTVIGLIGALTVHSP